MFELDEGNCIKNLGSPEKIPQFLHPIINDFVDLYKRNLHQNLHSIYIRGSTSVGTYHGHISDIDAVGVSRQPVPETDLEWVIDASLDLEKKHHTLVSGVELPVFDANSLLCDPHYIHPRVLLKTQSALLFGEDIRPYIPNYQANKNLAIQLYGSVDKELEELTGIFDGTTKGMYLHRERPTSFWCVWTMRTLLRAGCALVMAELPVYTRDLCCCHDLVTTAFPELTPYMDNALHWAKEPSNNPEEMKLFLSEVTPVFVAITKRVLFSNPESVAAATNDKGEECVFQEDSFLKKES